MLKQCTRNVCLCTMMDQRTTRRVVCVCVLLPYAGTVRTAERFKDIINNDHVRGESKNVLGSRQGIQSSFNRTHSNRSIPKYFRNRFCSCALLICLNVRQFSRMNLFHSTRTHHRIFVETDVARLRSINRFQVCYILRGRTILLVRTMWREKFNDRQTTQFKCLLFLLPV